MLYGLAGKGGMAEVFLGVSSKKDLQGQFVAIKKLHQSLNANKAFVNLLIHEAKISVLLNHPGIAQVFDLGSHQSEFFLAMEYVHGKSLDHLIEKIRKKEAPPLSPEIATYIICELLRALAFAHSLKDVKGRDLHIIHRDLSPGNILLDYKGSVKLTDFGIATAEARLQRNFTQSTLGKLSYMAPEQVVNDPVVKSTDLYSLSVVYYELLTGQLPYQSESSTDLFRKIVDGKLVEIRYAKPEISSELSAIIRKTLDKSAKKRYLNAPELFTALRDYFLKDKEIDFDSRATRAYFKKKLAAYLNQVFAKEIEQEIRTIQRAIRDSEELSELKSTAPIEIPRDLIESLEESSVDRTVFQPDLTNETTRHTPLDKDTRERILKDLPDAQIEELEKFEQEKERTSGFELATIPQYDLFIEDSQFQKLSVGQKLDQSSLELDEKRSLEEHFPAMEITSQQDLDAFESSTFSGKKPAEILSETGSDSVPLKRPSLSDEETVEAQTFNKKASQTAKPEVEPSPELREPSKVSVIVDKKRIEFNLTQKLKKLSSLGKYYKQIGVAGAAIFVMIMAWQIISHFNFQIPSLKPTQQISLLFSGEAGPVEQRNFFHDIAEDEAHSQLKEIEHFFNQAYRQFTGNNRDVLNLVAFAPIISSRLLSLEPNLNQLFKDSHLEQIIESLGMKEKSASDASLFFYLYSKKSVDNPNLFSDYIVSKDDKREGNLALYFLSTDRDDLERNLALIAQAIGFHYGVQINSNSTIKTLSNLRIGPEEAKQFGWISETRAKELLGNSKP